MSLSARAYPAARDVTAPLTMFGPDFPFAYDDWLRHPAGLGSLPAARHGTPVAVVGGGMAGLVAGHELLRLGLRPVLYEAGELGGRMRSVPFAADPRYAAELGAMRFPVAASTLFHYIDALGLRTRPFPNPLAPGTPSTLVHLGGERHYARAVEDLPPVYQQVADAWQKTLLDQAELAVMEDAVRRRDTVLLKAVWNRMVRTLDDQSFYGFLAASPYFRSFRHRELFGQVGFGTGGWDTDFPNSILEVLRVVFTGADQDQVGIVGGTGQLVQGLWRRPAGRAAHWPADTSLASLHEGTPRPAVTALRRVAGGVLVEDAGGGRASYPAVVHTPHVWTLLSQIDCDPALLSTEQWTAVERTHYMGSSKLFVLTDRPFWRDRDGATGRDTMSMTLSDRMPRGVYLFDEGPDRPGVICLSYTWNDDSLKVATLSDEQRLEVLLGALREIYPGVDLRRHIVGPPVSVTWETDPLFMGAFKANLPGQYRYQRRLFGQFVQDGLPPERRGLFLAGDDVSWTAGFAEGAVTTALNAVWGVLHHLGGATSPENPGPGDLFDQLAPVLLPED
ncbi:FAD-dependent oxidoreductase [Kitasatospora sp. NBC_01250]|uniref:flavin monoamine oxidase family protein n=1 Tax=unclassified Kitasatospora TaxID=2633591 RepID=UPI002E133556|nr:MULTISPECIES: NAD(P)/FAD-dependent oxidoreductase [unclassified Kitasatospora]WSJ65957.1 FAD-dependent oxidoreductase [Kitasatospora sp. NBC_01302]